VDVTYHEPANHVTHSSGRYVDRLGWWEDRRAIVERVRVEWWTRLRRRLLQSSSRRCRRYRPPPHDREDPSSYLLLMAV